MLVAFVAVVAVVAVVAEVAVPTVKLLAVPVKLVPVKFGAAPELTSWFNVRLLPLTVRVYVLATPVPP
jgi:hypothetical protein